MIDSALRLWRRFSQVERRALLACALVVPLLVAALIASAITGWWTPIFVGFAIYLVAALVLAGVAALHRYRLYLAHVERRQRVQPGRTIIGFDGRTDGWGRLAGAPGDELRFLTSVVSGPRRHRIAGFALGSRSPVALDLLALQATVNRFDYAGLVKLAALYTSEPDRARLLLPEFNRFALIQTARVVADSGDPDQHLDALLTMALSALDHAEVPDLVLLGRLLLSVGRREDVARVVERIHVTSWDRQLLVSDLLNPFADPTHDTHDRRDAWLVAANEPFRNAGIEQLVLTPARTPNAFDRLAAEPVGDGVTDGPLVSVVMSTYQPGDEVHVSVASIIAQSYRNWELLIVDDASGAEYDAALDGLAALDPRIRVIRAETNGGTYVRRNDALRAARGEFVTMQDSDDWSHPRRLELQVAHLQAHPAEPANTVYALRVSQELLFVQPRGVHLRLSEPGIMFRREQVIERIGYFDTVRKSADSEFRQRLEAVYSMTLSPIDTSAPLMLMRFDFASLSGSDYTDGWTHPARAAYRSAHRLWRERELAAKRVPALAHPHEPRAFPAPRHVGGAVAHPEWCDVLVVLDGQRRSGRDRFYATVSTEIADATRAGLKVAVMHVRSLQSSGGPPELHPIVQGWINDGLVVECFVGNAISAELVVFRHASCAIGLPRTTSPLVDTRRVVVVEAPGSGLDEAGANYARPTVERQILATAGVTPEWTSVGGTARVNLAGV